MLRERLPNNFVVATGADHPLLLKAADWIVGGEAKLAAIYAVKSEEARAPSLLRNRLILSRLALPPHTVHILLVDSGSRSLGQSFSRDFALVLDWTSRDDLLKIVQDTEFVGAQKALPHEVVWGIQRQFSDVMQVTRVMKNLRERRRKDIPLTSHQDKQPRRAHRTRSTYEAGHTATARFSNGRISAPTITNLVNEQIGISYRLDNSVPYPTQSLYYGLAIVDELPEYAGDPDKLLRAAAFGGWAMISGEQEDHVSELEARLAERRKKREA